jgi:hypothetical protein
VIITRESFSIGGSSEGKQSTTMVGTRGGTVTKPKAESYGRMHRTSQKHSNIKKKIVANLSERKITRKVEKLISTPPDLKKVCDEEKAQSSQAPSADVHRTTRNDPLGPRCFHYGRYRETIYKGQGHFFCNSTFIQKA